MCTVLCHSCSHNKEYIRKKKYCFSTAITFVPEGCGLIALWTTSHSAMSDKSCCYRAVTQNEMLQASLLPSTVFELHALMFMIFHMNITFAGLWHLILVLSLHLLLVNELSCSIVIVNYSDFNHTWKPYRLCFNTNLW